ncbi:MAG: ATP-dependent DNA ligase [Fimbriimonadaceae bacterium]|nr:ATP-dependent DNA ligase [Fimbriimonadaceae bacterium]QYK55587.1 MAG: ATP-dependent DNA ligase [Fimbriimonadaceae bacterium]
MRAFARLFERLDSTTRTTEKVRALAEYFREAPPEDAAWAVFFLSGRRLPSPVNRTLLRTWAQEEARLPDWLFQECYDAVADMAETMSKVVPTKEATGSDHGLAWWVESRVRRLRDLDEADRRASLLDSWYSLSGTGRFLFNKLVTGSFRVGVSQELVVRGLSEATGVARTVLSHRLMGEWAPTPEFFRALAAADDGRADVSRPYPFCLAHALTAPESDLRDLADWLVEWKWDGIRCQLIRREGQTFLWSRGEEVLIETFPDIVEIGSWLPDGTVIDGEILVWSEGRPRPFQDLQRRLGRKSPGKKLLSEVPCSLLAFDLLELNSVDIREKPTEFRRQELEVMITAINHEGLRLSPSIEVKGSGELAAVREAAGTRGAEGLMIKSRMAPYTTGRKTGVWWKWKVDPFVVDAVLVTAQRGNGKRASLYTDYTFAIWDGENLVPFAKAYSGLDDKEIREVDAFVRKNTQEKFGPVRSVRPELVFELAFEGVQVSKRHKSGLAVRFPRINRWRKDKKPQDADTVETVRRLVEQKAQ